MPQQDVSQLVLQVSASTAVAQRQLNDLARAVAANSNDIDKSLGKVEQAHARMGGSFNNSRIAMMELQHVARGTADQFAAGAAPTQIFAQHIGMLAEAGALAGGSLGKFGAFLAGPWGIAVTLGTAVLATLISKHHAASESVEDLVKKMRDQAHQADLNRQADEAWARTIDGLTDAIRKQREEQDKALQTDIQTEQTSLQAARNKLLATQQQIASIQQQLRDAKAQLAEAQQDPNLATNLGGPAQERINHIQSRIQQLNADLKTLNANVASAQALIRGAEAPIGERKVEDRLDAVKRATDHYTIALGNLRKELQAGAITQDQFEAKLLQAAQKRDAEIKAANEAKKTTGSGLSGNQIGFSEATKIAQSAGFTVTSGYRTVAQQAALYNNPAYNHPGNPVALPGSSAHNGINGRWALDIAFAPGLTPQKIRKVFGDQGVSLSVLKKETGHFHIEGSRSEAASAEREAQSAAKKSIRDNSAFQNQSDSLDAEIFSAKQSLTQDYHEQADLAAQQVEAEKKKQLNAIDEQQQLGQITEAQAGILRAKIEQLATAKEQNIQLRVLLQNLNEQDQDDQLDFDLRQKHLQYQDSIAKTANEHRRIQLEILDLVYQEKEKHLENLKAQADLNGNVEEAARLQKQINDLPQSKSEDAAGIDRANRSPLKQWEDQVPKSADEINAALQRIEVEGLDGIANGIAGIVSGTESMGQAFQQVAQQIITQITAMIVKMLIFKAIQAGTGAVGGGGAFSGTGADAAVGSGIYGDIGSLGLPGFASGGFISIGGNGGTDNNVLSINGRPRARVSGSEMLAVIPRPSRAAIPSAANSNSPFGGHTFNISVMAPNTGDPRRDRATALQQAAIVREQIAVANQKGAR